MRVRGALEGLGVIAREVTREKEEEEFQRHLVAVVSHDMRAPLSAISLSAEVLLKDEDLTEGQARVARRIRGSTARLGAVARDLLDLTRSRTGQGVRLERRRVDLSEITGQVLGESEASDPGRRFTLERSGDTRGDWDPARVAQALSNLVQNALAYSPAGTPIVLRCAEEPGGARVEVENQGARIPKELLAHLFEPFRRGVGADQGNRAGVGLGLFIVREIARAHGGSIAADSDERRTIFRLRLPRPPSEASEASPS